MGRTGRLWAVLLANLVLVGVLVAVGFEAHSLSVWAEGADYLADAAAIAVSLNAIRLARRPPTARRPQGFANATRYAAAVNAGWLLVLSVLVAVGAIERLVVGTREVRALAVLIVSAIAALVMLGGALTLGDIDDGDDVDEGHALTVRAVVLDTAADAASAAGVAVTGAVIFLTGGNYWLDPAVALVVAVAVGYHAGRFLLLVRASRDVHRVER